MPPNYVHQAMGITIPKCVRKPLSYDPDYVRGILTTIFLQDLDRQGASANLKAAMISGMHTFLRDTEQYESSDNEDKKIKVIPGYVKQISRSEKTSNKDNSYIGTKNLIVFTHDSQTPGQNEIISTDWVDTIYTFTALGTMEFEVALANTISILAEASRENQTQVWVRKFQQSHASDDPIVKTKNHRWAIDISVEFDEDEFFQAGSVSLDSPAEAEHAVPDYSQDAATYEEPQDVVEGDPAADDGAVGSDDPEMDPVALAIRNVIVLDELRFEVELDALFWIVSDHLATLSEEQWEYVRGMVDFLKASEKTNETVDQAVEAARAVFIGDDWEVHVESSIEGSYFDGTVLQYFAHIYADSCLAASVGAE